MSGKNLRVDLIANTSQFKSAMAGVKKDQQLLRATFRNTSAETDKFGNRLDNTGAKIKRYNGEIKLQRQSMRLIQDELKRLNSEYKKGNVTKEQFIQKEHQLQLRLKRTEASLKQYEGQLKKLNAQNSKFANVNKQMQAELDKNRQKVALVVAEYKKASSETDKYGNKIKNLGAETKKFNSLIDIERANLAKLRGSLKTLNSEYSKGRISKERYAESERKIRTEIAKTSASINGYVGNLKKVAHQQKINESTARRFAKSMNTAGLAMRGAGIGAGVVAGIGLRQLTRALGSAVSETVEFEKGMAETKAVLGATNSDMSKLTKQAKDLGKSTVFTAQQASEAMSNLARAGFETSEILEALPGLLDLAASSNMDLGRATEITADLLRGFNMKAQDSARVADVLAKSASMVNTDVEGMGNALAVVAPVASSLGLEIEGTSSAIAIMSDNGIKGEKAGRMLRQGLLRLSKPTGEAGKLIEELGINVFDSQGNMKDMDKVVGELEKGMKGMTKQQKASALATLFGSESTAGWTSLLDSGQDVVKDYSDELENAEGSAKRMADTMTETADGAITRMESALSGLKIELGERLTPILSNVADKVTNLADGFSNMDDKSLDNVASFGLMAVSTTALMTAIGLLVGGVGALIAVTSPIIVGGIALASVLGGIGIALSLTNDKTKELNDTSVESIKANTELQKSAIESRKSLEDSVETFDKLSDKSKISNAELAKMNEINGKIERSSNPLVIERLTDEYNELAKKSGLSKDELKLLFDANNDIIEQSPDVEKTINDQGDAWVENTDKVREYADALRDRSNEELMERRKEIIKEEANLLEILSHETDFLTQKEERLGHLKLNQNLTAEQANEKKKEANKLINEGNLTEEELNRVVGERNNYRDIEKGKIDESLEKQEKSIENSREEVEATQEKLSELDSINLALADNLLLELDINESGEKGLKILDEEIAKNNEEIEMLLEKKATKEGLTDKEQESLGILTERNDALIAGKDTIFEEFGISKDANSLFEHKLSLADQETQKKVESLAKTAEINVEEGNILNQIKKKNGSHDEEIAKLEEKKKKEGENKEEINKQIKELEGKKKKNDEIIEKLLKELGLWDEIGAGVDETKKKEQAKKKAIEDSNKKLHEQKAEEGNINKAKDSGKKKEGDKKNATSQTNKALDSQGKAIDGNNKKTDTGVKKEQERTKEAGKDVSKDVNVKDNGTAQAISKEASKPETKEVSVIQRFRNWVGFAEGTPSGGYKGKRSEGFLAGEEGVEIGHYRGKMELLPFGEYNRPHGYNVIPHEESMKILSAQANASLFNEAKGDLSNVKLAKNLNGASRAINQNRETIQVVQNIDNTGVESTISDLKAEINEFTKLLVNLVETQSQAVEAINNKDYIVEMSEKEVGKLVTDTVTNEQNKKVDMRLKHLGINE